MTELEQTIAKMDKAIESIKGAIEVLVALRKGLAEDRREANDRSDPANIG